MLETEARTAASSERARLIEALIEVAAERGYMDTSIEMIVDRAGLDRPAFDRHFRGKYDGFLTAWQEMNEECMASLMHAYDSEDDWPDRLRAVAHEVVGSLCNEPSRASFAVEVLAAGDAARARRDMTMRVIASLIDAGRKEMEDPESVPHTTAEALAGSAYGQVYAKVVRGDTDELPKLIPQLMSAAVMPYLGVEAALEELEKSSNSLDRYRRPVAAEPADSVDQADEYPPELARLPPGRHGLPREFVALVLLADQIFDGHPTSSKNTSLTSWPPSMVWIGRTVTPGVFMSIRMKEMPSCFFAVGIGAHEDENPVGVLGERRPGLLAVDDVLVALALGRGFQARRDRPGPRFGKALAPPIVEIGDARQKLLLLRLRAESGDHRPDHVGLNARAPARRCSCNLLAEDLAAARRPPGAAPFVRPVRNRPSLFVEDARSQAMMSSFAQMMAARRILCRIVRQDLGLEESRAPLRETPVLFGGET